MTRVCPYFLALSLLLTGQAMQTHAQTQPTSLRDHDGNIYSLKTMPDGNLWMTANLRTNIPGSYGYEHSDIKDERYGRLYTWSAANEGCRLLGEGWHLPSYEEWRALAKHYGGIRGDAQDSGKAAFVALIDSGTANFNIVFGGRYDTTTRTYHRVNAHGFYWSATESNNTQAWFLNLGRNGRFVNRHPDGDKPMAISVRCVKTIGKFP